MARKPLYKELFRLRSQLKISQNDGSSITRGRGSVKGSEMGTGRHRIHFCIRLSLFASHWYLKPPRPLPLSLLFPQRLFCMAFHTPCISCLNKNELSAFPPFFPHPFFEQRRLRPREREGTAERLTKSEKYV